MNPTTNLPAKNNPPVFFKRDGASLTSVGRWASGLDLVLQQNGKIIVTGFTGVGEGEDWDFLLTRYNQDGTLDNSFGNSGIIIADFSDNDFIRNVLVKPDGKILVAGNVGNLDGDLLIAQYNADGTVDTTFGADGRVLANSGGFDWMIGSHIQSDGKILIAGHSNEQTSDETKFSLMRYDSNGRIDQNFGIDGLAVTQTSRAQISSSMYVTSDGHVLVGGSLYNSDSRDREFVISRYESDGSLDTQFGIGGKTLIEDFSPSLRTFNEITSITVQSDGKILASGSVQESFQRTRFCLMRLNEDGSRDFTFGYSGVVYTPSTNAYYRGGGIVLQPDGKILYACSGQFLTDDHEIVLFRFHPDGSLDTSFGIDGLARADVTKLDDFANGVTLQSDGKIIVAGTTFSDDLERHTREQIVLVRFNSDGSIDPTFGYRYNPPDDQSGYIEDGAAVVLDSDVEVGDPDLDKEGSYAGASITIKRSSEPSIDDAFVNTGFLGSLTEGRRFDVRNIEAGSVTQNSGGILTLTFNSGATRALVNDALQSIAYLNLSNAPPANVTLDWTFSDGNSGVQGTGGALSATGSTTVVLSSINDAPVLTALAPNLTPVTATQTDSAGQTVASFLGTSLSDPDGIGAQGIAIWGVGGNNGKWQYRIVGLSTWADLGSVSASSALLLRSSDYVRWIHTGDDPTTAQLHYHGWDQSSGEVGSKVSVVARGDATAFSLLSDTANLEVVDAVYSSSSYTLADTETKLVLTGSSAINGTGNVLDNHITGNTGNNILSGMAGDDVLVGGAGKDTLDGGLGEDTADYSDQTADVSIALGGRTPWISVRIGNQVEDRLKNIEHLIGGSGNDSLAGDAKANRLYGGLGNDSLDGGAGADTLVGGAGDDTYTIDNAGDVIIESSGEGTDLIRTTLRQIDLIDYDHVENLTYTGRSNSTLVGSDIDNVIRGGSGNDIIEGGAGSDTLYGGGGADLLFGYYDYDDADINRGDSAFSDAAFQYEKEHSIDLLYGGRGNDIYLFDQLVNTPEVIEYRGEGTDTILGDVAYYAMTDNVENYINDGSISENGVFEYIEIRGNGLSNIIRSSPNWDLIPETAGLDWVASNINRLLSSTSSFESNERFFGMAGNDTLLGGAGDDYLSGGVGRDRLTGGTGADQFVFDAALNRSTNVDTITDFVRGQDKIVLDNEIFSKFTAGEDISDHFSGTGRALDSDDYLIYSASNKTLYYDADGNGGGAAVAFAVLTGVSTLSANDFFIV